MLRRGSALELAASACTLICALALGCYEAPKPACGFICAGGLGCPADYTCAADGRCHLDSAAPDLACPSPDAAIDAEPLTPFVTHYVPDAGDSTVAMNVTVTVTFNKPVLGITASSFTLTRFDTSTLLAADVSYDPVTRTASLDPQALLEPSRMYVATLGPEIVDMHGSGLTGTTTWMFSVAPDTTPPSVVMHLPSSAAVDVPVDTTIVAVFSEQISGITSASFFLEDSTHVITAPLGYVSQTSISLTPTVDLAPHTEYKATLTAAIMDFAGNPLLGAPIEWTFTTGDDTTAPEIATQFPEIDDSDIPLSTVVNVRFSEPVIGVSSTTMTLDQAGTLVPASVTYTATSRLGKLTPAAPLAPNTTYTVTMTGAITDTSGNALANAPVTWNFSTGS